jgi:PTS system N-acetylglucosamine-specific IIB component
MPAMDRVAQAQEILAGLGGDDNIVSLEPCITRLRLELRDTTRIDERRLRAAGALGVLKVGNAVQVVVGPLADNIEQEMRRLMR